MKFTLKQDKSLEENEFVINHNGDSKSIATLYEFLLNQSKSSQRLKLFLDEEIVYFDPDDLIFFETSDNILYAHSYSNAYTTQYKLYELEKLLPNHFLRISKSTICNINHIYSISRNITASGLIKFKNTNKQVYVSRMYYPNLKIQLERRLLNELQK